MDGMKMLKELRKDSWGKNVKVILLTNIEPSSEIIEGAVNDHPLYYWIKSDIKLEDVTKKVEKLLMK